MLLLTTVFCVCNSVYSITVILLVKPLDKPSVTFSNLAVFYTSSTFIPFVNSALNPTILILRSRSLLQYVWDKVRCREDAAAVNNTFTQYSHPRPPGLRNTVRTVSNVLKLSTVVETNGLINENSELTRCGSKL